MKKLAYLSMFAGLFLTGCVADYTEDPAAPQTWEQEEFITFPASVSVAAVEAIDLSSVEGDSVAIGTLTPITIENTEVVYNVVFEDTVVSCDDETLSLVEDYIEELEELLGVI